MRSPSAMTANDLSQIICGKLSVAPSSSRRWQRISSDAQRRSPAGVRGNDSVFGRHRRRQLAGRLSSSKIQIALTRPDVCEHARMRACGVPHASTYTRASENTSEHTNTYQGTARRGPSSLQCCPSCWWLGSHSCELSQTKRWGQLGDGKRESSEREEWIERWRWCH